MPEQFPLVCPGLAFPCTFCAHMAKALAAGQTSCGVDCRGPSRGGTFNAYEGPLKGNLSSFCFICGATPVMLLRISGPHGGTLGVCKGCQATVEALFERINHS